MTDPARLPGVVWALLRGDPRADRVVPPQGATVRLTLFAAAAMGFLALFALALAGASARIADRWAGELAQGATVRVTAPEGELAARTAAALTVLEQTPGIARARALTEAEQEALLAPWFGEDLSLDALPVPQLIELAETGEGYDAEGLRLRLEAEAPGAVLDDHARWRQPLVAAAWRLRWLAIGAVLLIGGVMAAVITLASRAALAANRTEMQVLRQVGALDTYIARAFVRRFTLRALTGAAVGALVAALLLVLMPSAETPGMFLSGLGLRGISWLWLPAVPVVAGLIAFLSTRRAALRALMEMR